MRTVFFLILLLSFSANSQEVIELKKKYLATYSGTIGAYKYNTGKDFVQVDETPITIQLSENHVQMEVGQQKLAGSYYVLFGTKSYWVLECTMDGQEARERIVVYKRGKKISRDGMFPQPNTFLEKTK